MPLRRHLQDIVCEVNGYVHLLYGARKERRLAELNLLAVDVYVVDGLGLGLGLHLLELFL